MSKQTVTEMVEQTYTKMICDYCKKEITPIQVYYDEVYGTELGADVHVGCFQKIIKEVFSKLNKDT